MPFFGLNSTVRLRAMFLACAAVVLAVFSSADRLQVAAGAAVAQAESAVDDAESEKQPSTETDSVADLARIKAEYEAALSAARQQSKVCRELRTRFFDSSLSDSYDLKENWQTEAGKLASLRAELERTGIAYFMATEMPKNPRGSDLQLARLAAGVGLTLSSEGKHARAYELLDRVLEVIPESNKDMMFQRDVALNGLKANKFARALSFIEMPGANELVDKLESDIDKSLFFRSREIAAGWKREQSLREEEGRADDLPRVELKFSGGKVVVELFQNEAPESVAHFLSLVESKFYDRSFAHPTVAGLLAQFGSLRYGVGPIDAGYVIKDESRLPESRKHFAGSVTMSRGAKPGSTGSRFAITLVPVPHLDWDGTEEDEESEVVIGRVIEGLDVVKQLAATIEYDEEEKKEVPIKDVVPDVLDKISIVRKRDEEYKFEKLK